MENRKPRNNINGALEEFVDIIMCVEEEAFIAVMYAVYGNAVCQDLSSEFQDTCAIARNEQFLSDLDTWA